MDKVYMCIDLKSFYASVECVEKGLDPMTTNLVVADLERGSTTICLAISPSMKALGIQNRCRVFQIPKEVSYITASPRMKLYIEYSASIYAIYLKYVSKEDIHVYSIDEAFLDVTDYLKLYKFSERQLAKAIMTDIQTELGITATAGIGTNLYLAKVALDIIAKHTKGHIAYLNEELYCQILWGHKPLTDFWRVGVGTAKRLRSIGISTMKEITQVEETLLYQLFGIDAELLIDHAWGRETTTMSDIKAYKPKSSSISSGQVLPRNYNYEEGQLIVKEMTEALCLELADKKLVTASMTMTIGYANEVSMPVARGTKAMPVCTNSFRVICEDVLELYEQIVKKDMPLRRVSISANSLKEECYEQYNLFTNIREVERDKQLQNTTLAIKKRFGNNAIIRGRDLQAAGTTMERNRQIGGHKSGD